MTDPKKLARLQAAADIRNRLTGMFNDPAVQTWFKMTEANVTSALIEAHGDDDRRELAAQARALRDLKAFVSGAIDDGDRARRELDGKK